MDVFICRNQSFVILQLTFILLISAMWDDLRSQTNIERCVQSISFSYDNFPYRSSAYVYKNGNLLDPYHSKLSSYINSRCEHPYEDSRIDSDTDHMFPIRMGCEQVVQRSNLRISSPNYLRDLHTYKLITKNSAYSQGFLKIDEEISTNVDIDPLEKENITNRLAYYFINSASDNFVNPYFQVFGGSTLGIPAISFSFLGDTVLGINGPIKLGLTGSFGTPYSGPFETDYVQGGVQLFLFNFSVSSSIKSFVNKYSQGSDYVVTRNILLGNWNNFYTPKVGMSISADLVYLIGTYFWSINNQDEHDLPVTVLDNKTGQPMKNNYVLGDSYFNFELRYPFLKICNSVRPKLYFAKFFDEYHIGYEGKSLVIDDVVFDFRLNFTFPGKRDYQFLLEYLFEIGPLRAQDNIVAVGPSFRFGKTPGNNFGVITAFLNMRIKMGDFFDPNLY